MAVLLLMSLFAPSLSASEGQAKPKRPRYWRRVDQPLRVLPGKDLEGRLWTASDLQGRTTVVNVWATWCGPCLEEMPLIQRLHEKLEGRKDALVLTINLDDQAAAASAYVSRHRLRFPVIHASIGQLFGGQSEWSLPQTWIVDDGGRIRYDSAGFTPRQGEAWLRESLALVLTLAPAPPPR